MAPSRTGGASDERALFERVAAAGDEQARAALIESFLPLARSVAMRYQRSRESIEDLMQVASIGLIKAVDGFDPERGAAFTSYAVPTILGELKRHFRDRTWAVRLPRDLQERSLRVDRTVTDLTERLRRQPTTAEIAAAADMSEEDVLEALQAGGAHHALSFDAPRGDGEGDSATLAESTGSEENGFGHAEARATLDALLAVLDARDREVLRMRFAEDMTQSEIGAAIGVSQMQVSRLIRRALTRLHAIAVRDGVVSVVGRTTA